MDSASRLPTLAIASNPTPAIHPDRWPSPNTPQTRTHRNPSTSHPQNRTRHSTPLADGENVNPHPLASVKINQPEDDLDNELIYELVVRQFLENKLGRQIIIVAHNANIVVNGDAEMVIPLSARNGIAKFEENTSIQNESAKNEICDALVGGQHAFEQRS